MRETATVTARLLARLGAGCLLLAATASSAAETIQIDGSSTVYPVAEAVAEEFQTARKGAVRVTVGISGTGGGFKKFCRGETDLSNASRPILAEEMAACRQAGVSYIEIPVAYDALTVAVSPKNDSLTCITLADLKKAFEPDAQGKVTRWNQVRPEWPDMELHLYGAGSDSGTFDYFTEAVVGKAKASRGDYTASEDDNVLVTGVAGDKYALGYFGLAYLVENAGKIKGVAIDNGKGCVEATVTNVENGTYVPLSRPLFIYVKKASISQPQVKAFVDFYLKNAGKLSGDVGYVKFPDTFYAKITSIWTAGTVGSIFSGKSGTVASILGVQ
jgi:phosphate transport system substrate-binding protein